MKVIVAGATGFLGSAIVHQALRHPQITQVVALARKRIVLGDVRNLDTSKLKIVTVVDYGEYPEDVRKELVGAEACIWTVAVTPFRAHHFTAAEVKRICQDCTMLGFEAMYEGRNAERPFRFLYFSAEGTPRRDGEEGWLMGGYQRMRGDTERTVLDLPKLYAGVEVCIAQPGFVTGAATWWRRIIAGWLAGVEMLTGTVLGISREELAAAVLQQVVGGFEKETLSNADLVRVGRAVLE